MAPCIVHCCQGQLEILYYLQICIFTCNGKKKYQETVIQIKSFDFSHKASALLVLSCDIVLLDIYHVYIYIKYR